MNQTPEWNIAIVDGQPELVANAAMIRVLMRQSPLGEQIARQRLISAGFPPELLEDEQ